MDDQFTSSFVLQHIRLVVTNFTLNPVEVEPTYCRLHLCVCVCVCVGRYLNSSVVLFDLKVMKNLEVAKPIFI